MRFSRFKQQMEGTASQPRKPKPAASRPKKTKPEKPPSSTKAPINPQVDEQREADIEGEPIVKGEPELQRQDGAQGELFVKAEPGLDDTVMQDVEVEAKLEPTIKEEITEDGLLWANGGIANSASTQKNTPELHPQSFEAPYLSDKVAHQLYPEPFVQEEDSENTQVCIVKRESTFEI